MPWQASTYIFKWLSLTVMWIHLEIWAAVSNLRSDFYKESCVGVESYLLSSQWMEDYPACEEQPGADQHQGGEQQGGQGQAVQAGSQHAACVHPTLSTQYYLKWWNSWNKKN